MFSLESDTCRARLRHGTKIACVADGCVVLFFIWVNTMSNQRIFSDLAELAGGAVGVLSSLKQQLRDEARERVDEFAGRLDLVTRADIDRLDRHDGETPRAP
jgi:hypothetical protein